MPNETAGSIANNSFRFSSCHGPESKQSDIYEQDVQPMVDKVFAGVDSTIFAYGVTGSGKTHTMQGTPDEPGIIPRVAQYLFDRVSDYPRHTVSIHVSYMEIYKELVYDLLIPRDGVSEIIKIWSILSYANLY